MPTLSQERYTSHNKVRDRFLELMQQLRRPATLLFTLALGVCLGLSRQAKAKVLPIAVPQELRSAEFTVRVNGIPIDVSHAAASYDFADIPTNIPVTIEITAAEKGFWDQGVDIQPWRLDIRPIRNGQTITFHLKEPAKLSISRPNDFLNYAKMLFLFVSKPVAPAPRDPGVKIIAAGIHKESLNPKSGETYYLEPGAVIYGSINLWKVSNVRILGRGVVVYDGPQNPQDDDGWMQKPDWHCIGALEAHHIEIDGVTCIVRSRTWSIQMKDSEDFVYDDIRVIGGNSGNANQDGMDWLGGGNTVVRDSFFRASDDVFAMQANWDGYGHANMIKPGHDVANISIEHSVLSTSISNIVRAGWPEKTLNSNNFTLKDSDILHGGIGSCGPPFALFTYWGADGAKGTASNYTFENLWLDDWYSLFQIEQEATALHGFTFRNIWGLGDPPLVPSKLQGQIRDVHIENVKYGQASVTSDANLPVAVTGGAQQPIYTGADKRVHASFQVTPAVLEPRTIATFSAQLATGNHVRYTWLFGDGTTARGIEVKHKFPDAEGTQLTGSSTAGSGQFRVLLHVEDKDGNEDWAEKGVTVVGKWQDAVAPLTGRAGLEYRIYPGTWPSLPHFSSENAARSGTAATLSRVDGGGFTRYAVVYDGYIQIPTEGGYDFHLLDRDGARLTIDGKVIVETGEPFAEVCGSSINAVRYARGTVGLRAGKHVLRLEALQSMSPATPRILWDGPGISLADVPASAFTHLATNTAQGSGNPLPLPIELANFGGSQ
jgi:hypothetical protein